MTVDSIKARYYPPESHPYYILETRARSLHAATVLDLGCGREAPVLRSLSPRLGVGMDMQVAPGLGLIQASAERIPLADESIDLVISRSVLEHLLQPAAVFAEVCRVLKPGGRFLFLTPSRWDYASIGAQMIPNRLHPRIVRFLEGRAENDVFPTCYRANTRRDLEKLSEGFRGCTLSFHGQYPAYFRRNAVLFTLGTLWDKFVCHFASLEFLRGWILGECVK